MAQIRSRQHKRSAHLLALLAATVPVAGIAQQEATLPTVTVKEAADVPYKADRSANTKVTAPLLDTPRVACLVLAAHQHMRAALSFGAAVDIVSALADSSPQTSMASAIAISTMFTTNSRLRRILRTVSFSCPSGLVWIPRITMAGSCENTLKKLIGAALSRPVSDRVDTSAIGRGPMKLVSRR